jgi:hypothetical protein
MKSARHRILLSFLALLGGILASSPARAQLPHLDPIPWYAPADSTSRLALVADLDRFHDPKFSWNLNRILLTAILPAGDDGVFFLRISHLTFDTAEVPVRSRWPWVIGEDAGPQWPGEQRVASFGRIEVGATAPIKLPLVSRVDYGLALGLPTGSDRVYPWSSTSLPFRLELRKNYALKGRTRLGLTGGYLAHLASGRDNLDDAAFPSGWHIGAQLDFFKGRAGRLGLAYDFHDRQNRRSQIAALQVWLPWSADGAVGFRAARELQGTLDRPAAWYFTFSVRLDSPRYRLTDTPPAPEIVP